MVLLADRNFAATALITQLATTGADLLIRCKNNRRFTITDHLDDGTALDGRVLQARTPTGVTQEVYAVLIVHQALRTAISKHRAKGPLEGPTTRPRSRHT